MRAHAARVVNIHQYRVSGLGDTQSSTPPRSKKSKRSTRSLTHRTLIRKEVEVDCTPTVWSQREKVHSVREESTIDAKSLHCGHGIELLYVWGVEQSGGGLCPARRQAEGARTGVGVDGEETGSRMHRDMARSKGMKNLMLFTPTLHSVLCAGVSV